MNRFAFLLWLALAIPARAEEPVTPPPGTADVFRRFANILDVLQKQYVDSAQIRLDDSATVAFRAFVRSLDPEADLLTSEEYAAAKNPALSPPVSTARRDGRTIVVAPRDGTAAQTAGIFAGDEVIQSTGSVFIVRELESQRVTIVSNDQVVAGPVAIRTLQPGIVYCRLAEITDAGAKGLREQLLPGKKGQRLILDLRNNPGGSFDAALQCARLFLPADARIVALDYAQPGQRVGFVSDSSPKFTGPIALLINGGTAAEAEILAAALRDNGRALLVGSQTFGRGGHYELFALQDGSALKIPTSRYLTPSKQTFQGTGLTPDFPVEVPHDAERSLARAGFGAANKTNDAALARAVQLLSR